MYAEISRVATFAVSLLISYGLYDQAIKLWRTKSSKDFAPSIIIALVANEIVWLNYGLSISEWPIVTLGLVNVPAATWIILGYVRAMRIAKPRRHCRCKLND